MIQTVVKVGTKTQFQGPAKLPMRIPEPPSNKKNSCWNAHLGPCILSTAIAGVPVRVMHMLLTNCTKLPKNYIFSKFIVIFFVQAA